MDGPRRPAAAPAGAPLPPRPPFRPLARRLAVRAARPTTDASWAACAKGNVLHSSISGHHGDSFATYEITALLSFRAVTCNVFWELPGPLGTLVRAHDYGSTAADSAPADACIGGSPCPVGGSRAVLCPCVGKGVGRIEAHAHAASSGAARLSGGGRGDRGHKIRAQQRIPLRSIGVVGHDVSAPPFGWRLLILNEVSTLPVPPLRKPVHLGVSTVKKFLRSEEVRKVSPTPFAAHLDWSALGPCYRAIVRRRLGIWHPFRVASRPSWERLRVRAERELSVFGRGGEEDEKRRGASRDLAGLPCGMLSAQCCNRSVKRRGKREDQSNKENTKGLKREKKAGGRDSCWGAEQSRSGAAGPPARPLVSCLITRDLCPRFVHGFQFQAAAWRPALPRRRMGYGHTGRWKAGDRNSEFCGIQCLEWGGM
ncbi:Protein of unknown function [Gryllus bimaculatus]|nr:Protein of unknown function [Gryllus bimaculatus]